MCLVCGTQVAVFEDSDLNCHYTTRSEDKYGNLSDKDNTRVPDALLAKLKSQHGLFAKLHTPRDADVRTTYVNS